MSQGLPAAKPPRGRRLGAVAGIAGGLIAVAGLAMWLALDRPPDAQPPEPVAALKAKFKRPSFVPQPAESPATPARIALGIRLFGDKRLSATGTVACASCHDPRLSFGDGEAVGKGVTGKPLARHTPTLWNVGFSPLLLWDGRASSLEAQARFPVEHPDEMGSTLEAAARRLAADASYVSAFAEAFPRTPEVSPRTIASALAAYERTLVSPPTRFDAWVAGKADALTETELRGLKLFAGKARCIACHTGFAFTDHNFYDIGLPDDDKVPDKGRGQEIGLAAANHAFKTPTLRELAWTAPYMHNGALASLEEVVRFYEGGGVDRPTRAKDLPVPLVLTDAERADLVAFLQALSSETPPQPSDEAWVNSGKPSSPPPPADSSIVSQLGKLFTPGRVGIKAGQKVTVLNDDDRTHNVRIFHPKLDFNSGAQEPKESVTIDFPEAGTYEAYCGIHPSMRLTVEVK